VSFIHVIRDLALMVSQPRNRPVACYDRIAADYARLHQRFLRNGGEAAVDVLCSQVAPFLRPGVTLLDVGAGAGDLCGRLSLLEPRIQVTAVDASPNMLARCPPVASRVQADAAQLPFGAESFDLVVSAWLLEAVPHVPAVLREMQRVLRPGGHLCFCCCTERSRWPVPSVTRLMVALGFGSRPLPEMCFDTDLADEASRWTGGRGSVYHLTKRCGENRLCV
jgi:ubiquinone/menaquinone biosynthesis C-methylase UbiE